MTPSSPHERRDDWRGVQVCVAGLAVSGAPAARVLAQRGARVLVVDARDGSAETTRAETLRAAGVETRLGPQAVEQLPAGTDLVVTSPGWRPSSPLLRAAAAAGVPVWGEVELAWRLRNPVTPWLGVTGTNGKTTVVRMVAGILGAAGHRAVAAGNVGLPLVDAVLADPPYDVIVAELSSYQLHWSRSLRCQAAAVLNIAEDHLDWHGSLQEYAAAKARIWKGTTYVVFNADDERTRQLASAAEGQPVPFTTGNPAPGQLGVRDGLLVDNAFAAGEVLAAVSDVVPSVPHNVSNALAAAALARAFGAEGDRTVPAAAVRDGLRSFVPDPHRMAHVATIDGVDYVDDSKATNPHAAAASLRAFSSVVWLAGGLAKGATFDELVAGAAPRLRAAVLFGRDSELIADTLERHAPNVPVVKVTGVDTEAMADVVRVARRLARPGDTVLLAPACASMDMFTDYAQRGAVFDSAVRRLAPERPTA